MACAALAGVQSRKKSNVEFEAYAYGLLEALVLTAVALSSAIVVSNALGQKAQRLIVAAATAASIGLSGHESSKKARRMTAIVFSGDGMRAMLMFAVFVMMNISIFRQNQKVDKNQTVVAILGVAAFVTDDICSE